MQRSGDDLICLSCLRQYRHEYLQQALEDQKGELSEVEQTVLTSLAEHDYEANLKAEIEIRQLHVKLDQLINHSWHSLLDIQRVQVDLMEELAAFRKK